MRGVNGHDEIAVDSRSVRMWVAASGPKDMGMAPNEGAVTGASGNPIHHPQDFASLRPEAATPMSHV